MANNLPVLQTSTLSDGTVLNPNEMAQSLLNSIAQAPIKTFQPEPTSEVASPLVSYAPQEVQEVRGKSVAEHLSNGGSKDSLTIAEVARQEVANLEANKKYDNLDKDHPIVNTAQLESTNPLISVPANLANMSLAVAATANNIYRNIKTIPDTVDAAMIESTVPDRVKEAYSNILHKNQSRLSLARDYEKFKIELAKKPNDEELLREQTMFEIWTSYAQIDNWEISLVNTRNPKTGNTFREDLDNAQAIRKAVLAERGYEADGKTPNAMNTREWYNQRGMTNLQENVAGDPDLIKANTDGEKIVQSFMSAFDNATNNLTTVPTTVAESIPYFVAPITGAVSALTDQAAKSTAQFVAREGRLPTQAERNEMLMYDTAYAGLNFVGDKAVNAPLKAVLGSSPKSMTASILGSTGRIASPMVTETAAEGMQSAIEGGIGSLGEFDNPVDTGIGAALGGLSGGVIGMPPAIANEISSKINTSTEPSTEAKSAAPTDNTTDVADLSNPTSPKFNATEAVKRYVFAYSQATTQEEKEAIYTDMNKVVEDNASQITEMEGMISRYEKVKAGAIERNNKKLNETLANPELSQEDKDGFTALVTKANESLQFAHDKVAEVTPEVFKANIAALEQTQDDLVKQTDRVNKVHKKVNYSIYDETLDLPMTQENAAKALQVANDSTLELTEDQRNNLRKFSAAIVALNGSKDLKDVYRDITTGSKNPVKSFRGLSEYLEQWNSALKTGKSKVMDRLYTQLTNFQDSHTKKYETGLKALNTVPKNRSVPVWKSGNDWVIGEVGNYRTSKDVPTLTENGGFLVHSSTKDFIAQLKKEVDAINTTMDYFNSGKTTKAVEDDFQTTLDNYNVQDRIIRNKYQEGKVKKQEERSAEPKAEDIELSNEVPIPVTDTTEVGNGKPIIITKGNISSDTRRKELSKINAADSFIGKGTPNSSTAYYEDQYGDLANKGTYTEGEKVFVSINGNRKGAVKLEAIKPELDKAIAAKAVFITDFVITSFNTGEKDLAEYLYSKGYVKNPSGLHAEWAYVANDPSTGTVEIPVEEDVAEQDIGTANLIATETVSNEDQSQVVEEEAEAVDTAVEESVNTLTVMQGDKETEKALAETDNRKESIGYQAANLLVASFTQVKSTYLAANKDFLSWLKEDVLGNATQLLGSLTQKQEDALTAYVKFNDKYGSKIEGFIRNKGADSKFKYQDWTQYLINEDGSIDENIKTAITAAMFSWVAENGGKRYANMEQVAALFGFKGTTQVPYDVFKEFTEVGQLTNQVIKSLGERSYKALGFKLDKGVTTTRKDKLQNALGNIAYVLLIDSDMIEEGSYSVKEFAEYSNAISAFNSDANVERNVINENVGEDALIYFTRAKWENNAPSRLVERVIKLNRGTQGLMGKLFGTENELRYPSFEPIKGFFQKTISNTGTEVPSDLAQKVKRMQAKPYSLNMNMVNFYQTLHGLNKDVLLKLLGYVPMEELTNTHISTRLEQQAINEGLERSIENNLAFIGSIEPSEDGQYPDMYMPMKVWEVNRIGIDATVLNEQGDKVSRSMIGMKDHTVTISLDNPFNEDGSITPYGYYLLAIGSNIEEAPLTIGITPDKTTAAQYIPSLLEYLNTSPVVAQGVAAMRDIRNGQLGDLGAIQAAVSEFGMGSLSVMALDSLVDYFDALEAKSDLTTSLAFESDGVTNGLILSTVAYGAYSNNLLEAGGLYGFNATTEVNVGYRAQGGKDVYQQIGESQKRNWSSLIKDILSDKAKWMKRYKDVINEYQVITAFFDSGFGERKGAKVAATPFVYGSSFGSINRAIAYNFIKNIYKKVEKHIDDPEGLKVIQDNLNVLVDILNTTGKSVFVHFDLVNASKESLLNDEFDKAFIKAFIELDGKLRGKATISALKEVAFSLIDSRTRVTAIANKGAELFSTLYEAMYKKVEADNVENIPTRFMKKKGELTYVQLEPMSDALEQEVMEALKPYESTIQSANSVFNSKNKDEAAHRTYSFSRDKYYEYSSQHVFAKAPMNSNRKTYNLPTTKRVVEPKGVGISALLIQAMDAFVTATTSSSVAATNHHDANGSSVSDVVKMATTQNQAFTTVQSRYHLNSASLNALFAPIEGLFNTGLFDEKVAKDVLDKLFYNDAEDNKGLFRDKVWAVGNPNKDLRELVMQSFKDDLSKLRKLTDIKSVNQYGTEGGQYLLTNTDRSLLLKEISKLEKLQEAYLAKADKYFPPETVVKEVTTQEVVAKPVNAITNFLKDYVGKSVAFSEVSKLLVKQVSNNSGNSLTTLTATLAAKGLEDNVMVYVVDGTTVLPNIPTDITDVNNKKYAGLATRDNEGNPVIIVNIDQVTSNLLVHEYAHVLTMRATASNDPKAKQLVKELGVAMQATKDFYEKNINTYTDTEKTLIEYALTDVDEFIAVGFSSVKFQEILMKVTVPKVTNRRFEVNSIFKLFIDSVAKYLGIKAADNTALASLIYNGTSLMVVNQNIKPKRFEQQALFSAVTEVDSYSVEEIFDALNTTGDSEFNAHLKDVFNNTVKDVHSLVNSYDSNQYTPFQVWESLVQDGKAPYSSSLSQAGFSLTAQERFTIESLEVSIKAALNSGFNTPVYRELLKVYEDARKTLTPESFFNGTWLSATQEEQEMAKAKFNALFEGNASNGRSDYMSKFIAASLGSKEVRELMGNVVSNRERSKDKKSYYEKLTSFINSVMNWVNGYLTRTLRTDTAKAKLPILAKQLLEIKNQRKDGLVQQVFERINSAQAVSNQLGKTFGNKGADLLNGLAASKRGSVRGATKSVQSILRGTFMDDINTLQEWRDFWHSGKPYGTAAELLSEFAEPSKLRQAAYNLIRKHNLLQQHRQKMIDVTQSDLLKLFDNKLSKENRNLISNGLLRTNMQVMLKHTGIKGITNLFGSEAKVDAEILRIGKELDQYEDGAIYKVRAKDLAIYQLKGEGRTGLAKSSEAIVRNVGLDNYFEVANKEAVSLVEQYVALHTIKFMSDASRKSTEALLVQYGTQLNTVLQYHGAMIKESKDTLFNQGELNIIDGYLPEITNPHKEISTAASKEDEVRLTKLGFNKVVTLKNDPNDALTVGERTLYITDVSTRQRFSTGAISITNTARKGTSLFANADADAKQLGVAHKLMLGRLRKAITAKAKDADNYDPRKELSSTIPVYRNDGTIMDYRYEMGNTIRDSLLERNNDFSKLLGTYKGSIFDKVHTPTHNKEVLKMLHDDWTTNGVKQRHKFTEVSAKSDDPRIAELYKLLPTKTKAYAKALYGEAVIMIRTDLLRPVFGFHKLTIGNVFDKDPDMRGMVENFTVQMANVVLRDNPKAKVMKAEQAIQDIMAVVKNVIVIRNISTLLGNQTANMSILMARGINPKNIVEDSIEALRAGTQYRKDVSRKISLEQQLLARTGNAQAINSELNRINDSLNRNPLKEFIAAGMMPTIVEDLDNANDEYAYTTKFAEYVDAKTSIIPQGVKTAAKWAVVAQGTPAYEFLSNATQFSDFMAKYVVYKHVTTREGGNHQEGIELADKLFIAYDVPTSPMLQYLNDMGLVMFTKYYIRIQRAMFYLLKNYPTTSLAQTMLAASGNYAGALDPSMLGGIGNPFTTSVFGVPSAVGEPFPIKMLLGF